MLVLRSVLDYIWIFIFRFSKLLASRGSLYITMCHCRLVTQRFALSLNPKPQCRQIYIGIWITTREPIESNSKNARNYVYMFWTHHVPWHPCLDLDSIAPTNFTPVYPLSKLLLLLLLIFCWRCWCWGVMVHHMSKLIETKVRRARTSHYCQAPQPSHPLPMHNTHLMYCSVAKHHLSFEAVAFFIHPT